MDVSDRIALYAAIKAGIACFASTASQRHRRAQSRNRSACAAASPAADSSRTRIAITARNAIATAIRIKNRTRAAVAWTGVATRIWTAKLSRRATRI